MRPLVPQEIRIRTANPFRLDSSHRQIIETTSRTASPTLQTFRMDFRECLRLVVDLIVQITKVAENPARSLGFPARSLGFLG